MRPHRARSDGNVPKGSAYGIGGIIILTGLVPFLIIQSLVPLLPDGIDMWMNSILPALGLTTLCSLLVVLGLRHRRIWYIWFLFLSGSLVLSGFLFGFFLDLALLLRLVPGADPNLYFIDIVNMIFWILLSPLAWFVLHTLGYRYIQPWTTPDQWEPPDTTVYRPTTLLTWWIAKRNMAVRTDDALHPGEGRPHDLAAVDDVDRSPGEGNCTTDGVPPAPAPDR